MHFLYNFRIKKNIDRKYNVYIYWESKQNNLNFCFVYFAKEILKALAQEDS